MSAADRALGRGLRWWPRSRQEAPPAGAGVDEAPVIRVAVAKVPADQAVRAPTSQGSPTLQPLPTRQQPRNLPGPAASAAPVALTGTRPTLDLHRPILVGALTVAFGAFGFVGWAATAPLSEGVPAEGFVKVETSRKPVQHLRGGIVESVMVREGQRVLAQEPVLKLNDVDVRSRLAQIDGRLMSALALQARLLAERSGSGQIVFPVELTQTPGPAAREAMQTQQQLFAARRGGLNAEVSIQDSTTGSLQSYVAGLKAQLASREEQIRSLQVELRAQQDLASQGYVARTKVSEIERQILLLQGQRSEDLANIGRAQGSITESRLRIVQRRSDASKDVETQLTEIQAKVNELRDQRGAVKDELDRVVVRAPAAGVVVDLAVHAAGTVITPSQRLMDIVPAREPLVVEAMVPTHLLENVHEGGACEVRFTGPDQSVTKPVPGKVVYVAADRTVDPARGTSYFITRVQVSDEVLAQAGLKVMQSGMPATVMITTAQRTMLQYLLAPLTKRMNTALTER